VFTSTPGRGAVPKGKLGTCDSPSTYPDLSSCVASASACEPVGTCFTMEDPIDCGANYSCPPGGCPVLRVETVEAAGYCDIDPAKYTLHCKKCAAFACAEGHAYQTMAKCTTQQDPQCATIGWSRDACAVGSDE
jgi:hypothetical protein